jgi:excisionase family DNA binding protein
MTEKLLTLPQTAAMLGCSRMHVYRLIQSGALASVDIALPEAKRSKTRIPDSELNRYLTERESRATKED